MKVRVQVELKNVRQIEVELNYLPDLYVQVREQAEREYPGYDLYDLKHWEPLDFTFEDWQKQRAEILKNAQNLYVRTEGRDEQSPR